MIIYKKKEETNFNSIFKRNLTIFLFFLALLLIGFSVSFIVEAVYDCSAYDGNQTACLLGNRSQVCQFMGLPTDMCTAKGCWNFNTNASCTNASLIGLPCTWNSNYNFCSEISCYQYDDTNESACENNTVGIPCEWSALYGLCDPPRQTCTDYNNSQTNCMNTFYCMWNSSNSKCLEPPSMPSSGGGGGFSPGCFALPSQSLCNNASGKCTWSNNQCTGVQSGLQCSDINNSDNCNTLPIFSTCCAWNNNRCNTTFSTSCWDNMQEPPTGANFCEDFNAIKNQSLCSQIAGSPWFMPCKWINMSTTDTSDDRCSFNGDDFFKGGGGLGDIHFEDINSKSNCEAAGGVWQTKSFTTSSGSTQNEQWCEMKFGIGAESCDSACWACEFQDDGSGWASVAAAQAACEASDLRFCKWSNKTQYENSPNGLGFCDKPMELDQGGCGTKTSCEDYKYYSNPQTACNNDPDCRWMNDIANPTQGYCTGANTKTCQQSCSQCPNQQICELNGTNCQWDSNLLLCKNGGSGGGSSTEVCFNGVDDDNDNMIDCSDSNCLSDPFCGGGSGVDCYKWGTNATCSINGSIDCVWVVDPFSNQSWCDLKGTSCWIYDDNENSCNGAPGCHWKNQFFGGQSSFCDVNDTFFNVCFGLGNSSVCNANGNCSWTIEGFGQGFCDPKMYSCMERHFGNQTGCNADTFCNWETDLMFPGGGRCEGKCFSLTAEQCNNNHQCEISNGWCEPESFAGGGCMQYDGNRTACQNKTKCVWRDDPFFNNDSIGMPNKGFCNDAMMATQFQGMEGGQPTIIATDSNGCGATSPDASIEDQVDICGLGVKDMDNSFGFGIKVDSLSNAAMCKNKPLSGFGTGSGNKTANFYIYLDSDNNPTNNCNSSDNNATGFEFYFSYESSWSSNQLSETKLAYRCINRSWGLAPISVTSWPEMSCKDIGAAILAISKTTLETYSEYNKSANLRLYATSNNQSNKTNPLDTVGPDHYKPGSADFVAEDCKGFIDKDGDGCLPADDPDCMIFNKFGYVPFEICDNGLDDNFDNMIDCIDPMCKYDQFLCGGSFVADANDHTPPSLAFTEVQAMPDGASVKLNTFEPANATLTFYYNDSACTTVNLTIYDASFFPWRVIQINNFQLNSNRLGFDLQANKSYYYKYQICDISNNCLASACSNFTTPASYAACGKKCNTFLDPLGFSPPSGTNANSPLGNLEVAYDTNANGTYDINKTYGSSSSQKTLNETKVVNIKISNPNSTTPWAIECINGTIPSTVSFNTSNLVVNQSSGNGLVGMPSDAYSNKFISDFNCKKIRVTLPFNGNSIYKCQNTSISGTTGCTNVTGTAVKISNTSNTSTWEYNTTQLGFSYYQAVTGTAAAPSSTSTSSSSSGGGGGGGGVATVAASTVSKLFTVLTPTYNPIIPISNKDIPFTLIKFKVTETATMVKFVFKGSDDPSIKMSKKVYKYVEISMEKITDEKIKDVQISFKVPLAWITENKIGTGDVALYRYSESWSALDTKLDRADDTYAYYKSTSPGMSLYAVSSEKLMATTETPETTKPEVIEEEQPVEGSTAETPVEEPQEEITDEMVSAESKPEKGKNTLFVVAITLIVIIAIGGYFYSQKKKNKI